MQHLIRRFMPFLFALAALSFTTLSFAQAPNILGEWRGTYNINIGGDRDIIFTLIEKDGVISGTFDDPAGGIEGVTIAEVSLEGKEVHFSMPRINGDYFGTIHRDLGADGNPIRIDGDWSLAGEFVPITLHRTQ
jgi:hypothetical protein